MSPNPDKKCPTCAQYFEYTAWSKHTSKCQRCQRCGYSSAKSSHFNVHKRLCRTGKGHACSKCRRLFPRRNNKEQHESNCRRCPHGCGRFFVKGEYEHHKKNCSSLQGTRNGSQIQSLTACETPVPLPIQPGNPLLSGLALVRSPSRGLTFPNPLYRHQSLYRFNVIFLSFRNLLRSKHQMEYPYISQRPRVRLFD